jgi:predicted transcriptional regulator
MLGQRYASHPLLYPNVSRALRELLSRELISNLTPNEKVGKIFVITERGRTIIRKISEMGGT